MNDHEDKRTERGFEDNVVRAIMQFKIGIETEIRASKVRMMS